MEKPQNPKIQNSSSFQKSKIPKNPTQVSGFWKLEREPQNPKIQNSSSFQKSKIPKSPTQVSDFWKLEREPQSPKTQNSSSFQKSKNPKIPTQVSDFWKLEREPQNPKFVLPLEFPKIQTLGWIFWIFGFSETRAGARFLDFEAPARVRKNPNLGVGFLESKIPRVSENPKIQKFQPKFRILGNSSGSLKIQNSCSRSSFQKPKPWGGFFGLLDFWKLEEFLVFGF